MSEYAGYLVGEYAKCVMTDGSMFAEGEVIAWHPMRAYVIQQADGTRVSWNEDLVRATRRPTHHDHDTSQAVAIEREAIAGWHDAQSEQLTVAADGFSVSASIGGLDDRSARILKAMREAAGGHEFAAQAIRSGEHVKP